MFGNREDVSVRAAVIKLFLTRFFDWDLVYSNITDSFFY